MTMDHFLVGALLISLKITGEIDWSWWIVLMPIYLPFTLYSLYLSTKSFLKGRKKP